MLLLLKIKPLVFVVILFQCVFYVTCGCSNEYDDVWCTSKKDEVVALCMRGEFKSVCDGSYLSTFYENNLDCPTDGYCNAEKIDHCKNNPCKNSGECIPLFGSYLCVCDSDHHGMDCAQSGTGKYVKEVYFVPAIMTIPKPVSHFGSSLVFIKDLGSHLSMFFTSESSGEAAIIHEQQFLKTENGRKECWAHANDKRRLLWEIEYMLKFCEDVPEEPMYYVAIFHTVLYKPSSKVLIENYPKSTSKLFAYDSHGLTIKILNRRSEEFRRKFYQIIIYRALVCPTLLKLEMCGNFYLTRKKIDRRQSNIIRSIFEKNEVCPTPNTEYNWEIYNYKSGHINEFPQSLDLFIPASNMFKVQPYSLKIGVYQIALTIFSEGGSPTFGKYSTANNGLCFLEIKRLELYAVIKGGSERTIAESETVIFDATGCYDPNEPLNYQTHLQWSWSCDDPSEDFCKFRTVREGLYKINKRLTKGKTYIFTLRLSTMTGEDDRKEVTQTITVTKNPQPQLEINCLKNCGFNNFKTNRKEVVYLEVTVLNKLDINDISWKYSIGDGPENDVNDLKLDGVDDRILIVKENVLQLDSTYTFFVKAKSNDGVDVQSNIKIMVNSEPKLGECTIQSVTGELVAGLAQFDITCTGFRDRNTIGGQLNYEFYQMSSKNAGLGTLLGYSITGRIENVILTEGTVRVKVSDTYGMYVDYFTTVELEKIESTSEETKVLFSTLSLLASIGDTSGSVRAAGALIDVMEDVLDKRNLITDILETLETDTVRDIYDAKLYSSTLRKITIEGLSQLKDGFDSKGVKSMGSLMFSVSKGLLSNVNSINRKDSPFTGEDINDIALSMLDCTDGVINSKDESIFKSSTGSLAKFSMEKQYKEGTSNVVRTLGLTGLSVINNLLPHEEETVLTSKDTLMWLKVESPERLADLTGIPSNSSTKLTISEHLGNFLKDKSEHVAMEVTTIKNNPYWWDEGDKDIASEVISIRVWDMSSSNMSLIDAIPEPLDIYLNVKDSKSETLKGKVTMPDPSDSDDQKDSAVVVHTFEVSQENSNGKLFVEFTNLEDTELMVLMSINLRPDYELMMKSAKRITSKEPSVSQAYENVTADSLQFIAILPGPNVSPNQTVQYSMDVYSIQCKARQITSWSSPACTIGEETSKSVVHCKCSHMSFFGSSIFIAPNMLHPINDMYLLLSLKDNPLVFIIITTLLILYVILLIWTLLQDRKDEVKRKVIVLQDNYPGEEYAYLIVVYTAFNIGSGTDANVGIQLIGSSATSRAHILHSNERKVLRRNSDDWFLIFTRRHLGTLEYMNIWHDNSGVHPDWFCKKIIVFDISHNRGYTFVIEQWLSVWPGEFIQIVKDASSTNDVFKWKRVIVQNIICNLQEKHLWFSIFSSHPRTTISKSKRLTMAFCVIMVTFLTGIMFYGVARGDAIEDEASYTIKLRQIIIAIQSAVIAIVVTSIVFTCFKRSQVVKSEESTEVVTYSNVATDRKEEQKENADKPKTKKKGIVARILSKALRGLAKGRPLIPVIVGKESPESIVRRKRWAKFGWITSQIFIWGSGYLTILYGLKLGKVVSQLWITSALFCFVNNIFFSAPIRIIIFAFVSSAFGEMYNVMTFECEIKAVSQNHKYGDQDHLNYLLKLRSHPMYWPLTEKKLQDLRKSALRRNNILQFVEFLGTVLFILVLFNITGELWKKRNYYINSHLNSTLSTKKKISAVELREATNPSSLIDYVISTLVPAIYREKWYDKNTSLTSPEETLGAKGWVEDAAHRQIGVPQLRQLRVRPENCTLGPIFNLSGIVCLSDFNEKTEDRNDYGLNWGPISKFVNKPVLVPWSYTSEVENESPIYGKSGKSYHSGGYIMRLANTQKECNRIISDLIDTGWLDIRMRAFIMELSLYNTNTDTYSLISVLIEHLQSGAFTSRVQVLTIHLSFHIFLISFFGCLLLLFNIRTVKVVNRNGLTETLCTFWGFYDFVLFGLCDVTIVAELAKILRSSIAVHIFQEVGDSDFFYFSNIVHYQRVSLTMWSLILCLAPLRIMKFKPLVDICKPACYSLYKNKKLFCTTSFVVIFILLLQFHAINFSICPTNLAYNVDTKYFETSNDLKQRRSTSDCKLTVSLLLSFTSYIAILIFQTIVICSYKRVNIQFL